MTTRPTDDQVVAALRASEQGDDELPRLRVELADAADRDGLLDVAYRTIDSPFGELLLAATEQGLVRVAFESEGHDLVLAGLAASVSPRILRSGRGTEEAARELEEYFAGRRRDFDLQVDLQLVRGFRREVIEHLVEIPYGTTESYAQVARRSGNAAAVRAVGSACANNPLPVVLPCHRVVRSDGTIGQYLGGTATKVALLELEAAA